MEDSRIMVTARAAVAAVTKLLSERHDGMGASPQAQAAQQAQASMSNKSAPHRRKVSAENAKSAERSLKVPSGQSGPRIEIEVGDLNRKERRVLFLLLGDDDASRETYTLGEMADALWAKSKGPAVANSWVRNSLRRLVRAGYVEKVAPGCYRVSASGRSKIVSDPAWPTRPKSTPETRTPRPHG